MRAYYTTWRKKKLTSQEKKLWLIIDINYVLIHHHQIRHLTDWLVVIEAQKQ